MSVTDIIIYILILVRLLIAIKLIQMAVHKKMRNLLWLAIAFYIYAVFYLFGLPSIYNLFWLRWNSLGIVFIALFTNETFYMDRRSPLKRLLVFTLLCIVTGLCLTLSSNPTSLPALIGGGMINLANIVNWGWHGLAARKAYKAIAAEKSVPDWVKARYQLIFVYSLLIPITAVLAVSQPLQITWLSLITGLFLLVILLIQFLAWVMPEPFRRYLSRNENSENTNQTVEPLSEEEIMQRMAEE